MSGAISNWKRYIAKTFKVRWQTNYFDHRIRNAAEHTAKYNYILRNPVVKGLCAEEEDWPWKWSGKSEEQRIES